MKMRRVCTGTPVQHGQTFRGRTARPWSKAPKPVKPEGEGGGGGGGGKKAAAAEEEEVEKEVQLPQPGSEGHLTVRPGRYCYCPPRHRHAFCTLVARVKWHPMTWRAIFARP